MVARAAEAYREEAHHEFLIFQQQACLSQIFGPPARRLFAGVPQAIHISSLPETAAWEKRCAAAPCASFAVLSTAQLRAACAHVP